MTGETPHGASTPGLTTKKLPQGREGTELGKERNTQSCLPRGPCRSSFKTKCVPVCGQLVFLPLGGLCPPGEGFNSAALQLGEHVPLPRAGRLSVLACWGSKHGLDRVLGLKRRKNNKGWKKTPPERDLAPAGLMSSGNCEQDCGSPMDR
ncbi:hypothetical protein HJG60_008161 [Phyllostomus discolor]|uniref:Uncharacterized protein n=1 Tax=Phyllostomus discolor TaxID=89673 RepID=A0A833Z6D1_9CHIR|nr:hypothetical protein HJG60_008161 [Phyllostomus discolor]